MRKLHLAGLLLVLAAALWGCSGDSADRREPDLNGYVVEKTDKSFTIVWDVRPEDIAGKSVRGALDAARPNAMTLHFSDTAQLEKGEHVAVWTTGTYNDSFPGQGTATAVRRISD